MILSKSNSNSFQEEGIASNAGKRDATTALLAALPQFTDSQMILSTGGVK